MIDLITDSKEDLLRLLVSQISRSIKAFTGNQAWISLFTTHACHDKKSDTK